MEPFLFLSQLFAVQSAPLWRVVTCLRAKSWQAAWQSKGPALAAKRAHIAHPPVARSYGYIKWQTTVNTLTLFIYLSVCVHVCLCACKQKTLHDALVVFSNVSAGKKICQNALFVSVLFVILFVGFCSFHILCLFVSFLLFVISSLLNPVYSQTSTHVILINVHVNINMLQNILWHL